MAKRWLPSSESRRVPPVSETNREAAGMRTATSNEAFRRVFFLLLLAAVLAYAGAGMWLMMRETSLIFRAGRPLGTARPAPPFEHVDLPRADGAKQFAWAMRPREETAAAWVLYLHGNDATVASRMNILHYDMLRALGVNVLAPEYRGYGGLDGVPSEQGLYTDARAAYDYVRERLGVPPDRIAIYGWSLGGAVAVDLASEVPHAALILEGAPASLANIGQQMYPMFPIRLIMRNPFEAVLKIGRVTAPILILHASEDEIVPITEGRLLFASATAPKTFVEVRGGHVDAARVDSATFVRSIARLLESVQLVPSQVTGS